MANVAHDDCGPLGVRDKWGRAKRRDLLAKQSLEFDVLAGQASACAGESRGHPHDLVEEAVGVLGDRDVGIERALQPAKARRRHR